MTLRHWLAAGLAALALTACDNSTPNAGDDYALSEDMSGGAQYRAAPAAPPPPPPPPPAMSGNRNSIPAVERLMAYRYDYQFETPGSATASLFADHQASCTAAGPAECQITGANSHDDGRGSISANLQLRASPAWIEQFRTGLAAEVTDAGGRIQHQSQSAEDLTSVIYDLEARLGAKRVLRDRLTALLGRDGASVEELVSVERQLAQVQGDIEGSEAQIRAMRGRVSMSVMGLNYTSRTEAVSPGVLDPLSDALKNVVRELATGLGNVIRFVAGFAPWMLVIVPVFWLLSRWLRGLFRARQDANAVKRAKAAKAD